MSQRRTLILIAAIVIGAFASFLVWNYVGGIQDQAYSDAERVNVFLVKEPIQRGTSGNVAAASIVKEEIPRKFKPANAISSLDDIAGRVARGDLVANQVVVNDMFVEATDPEAQATFAENIQKIQNKDMTTFTMSVDTVRGVAGLIVPGDYVNILVTDFSTSSGAGADDKSGDSSGGTTPSTARYLYQKVQVLAVDSKTVGSAAPVAPASGDETATTTPAPAGGGGLLTFIVPVDAAQLLASMPAGSLYLTLVSKDYKPSPTGQVNLDELPSENATQLTPYGPNGARGKG